MWGNVGYSEYKIQALDAKDFNNLSMILKWKNTKRGKVFLIQSRNQYRSSCPELTEDIKVELDHN